MSGPSVGTELEAIPVRLEIDLGATPPAVPFDRNTGNAPSIYRGGTVGVQVGIFDSTGTPVPMDNLASLQLVLQTAQGALVAVATVTETVLTDITAGTWQNGTAENATFTLAPAITDLGLGGEQSAAYWIVIQGTTQAGNLLIYGAGPINILNPGSSLPPPASPPLPTSRHAQSSASGDLTVTPTSQMHVEELTIAGAARTSNVILGTTNIQDGARLDLVFGLPATIGIVLALRSGIVTNPVIQTIDTGDVLTGCASLYYSAAAGAWKVLRITLP